MCLRRVAHTVPDSMRRTITQSSDSGVGGEIALFGVTIVRQKKSHGKIIRSLKKIQLSLKKILQWCRYDYSDANFRNGCCEMCKRKGASWEHGRRMI